MTIGKFHASHIRRVNVGFIISGPNVDPGELSALLKIQPDSSAQTGDERRNVKGSLLGYEEHGWWRIDSQSRLKGSRQKDINEHLNVLLKALLPHREVINRFS